MTEKKAAWVKPTLTKIGSLYLKGALYDVPRNVAERNAERNAPAAIYQHPTRGDYSVYYLTHEPMQPGQKPFALREGHVVRLVLE